jgi:hypothetical protein
MALFFPLLIGVGVSVLAVVFVYYARKNGRRARLIDNAPAARAQDLTSGPAKMMGYVVPLERPIHSPISGTPCVYYRFKVEERRSSGRSSYWATVIDDIRCIDCGLEDDTGTAEIALEEAEIELTQVLALNSGMLNDPPPDLKALLERRYNFSTEGWVFNKTLRYSEVLIEEGDRLFVVGHVETFRKGPPRFTKGGLLLLVSDKTEDQVLSVYKWWAVAFWVLAAITILVPLGVLSLIILQNLLP